MKRVGLGLLLLCWLVSCRVTPLDKARESVNIGDLREDALPILSVDAWYHQPCQNRSSIDDLFFYNSHQYDKADIVIVTSVLEGEEYRVDQISSFEPSAWHAAYQDCINRDRFED